MYDKYVFIIIRFIKYCLYVFWFINEFCNEKCEKCCFECRFRKFGFIVYKLMFEVKCVDYNNLLE